MSLDSLNLLMTFWIVDGEMQKFIQTSQMMFLNLKSFSQSAEPHPILTCE